MYLCALIVYVSKSSLAMDATEGLVRGQKVRDPIMVSEAVVCVSVLPVLLCAFSAYPPYEGGIFSHEISSQKD